jgi:hypothetical protein
MLTWKHKRINPMDWAKQSGFEFRALDQGKQSEECLHRIREFILRIELKGQDLNSGLGIREQFPCFNSRRNF